MRDPKEQKWLRVMCAKAAAPYVHPRLAHIDHSVGMKTSIVISGGLPDGDGDNPVLDLGLEGDDAD